MSVIRLRLRSVPGIVVMALLLVSAALAWEAATVSSQEAARAAATPLPTPGPVIDVKLKTVDGQAVSITTLRGKVVLFNFWATWCSPCREEMPVLQAYYDAHRAQGFELVGVNVSDEPSAAQEYVRQGGYTFPLWLDPIGDTLIRQNLNGLPASLVVDRNGARRDKWIGPVTSEMLEERVTSLLDLE